MADMSYLAGFFDGEGCITTFRNHVKRHPGEFSYCLKMNVSNTNLEVLKIFEAAFGGGIFTKKPKEGFKQAYVWQINGVAAKEVLKQLLPHLVVKKAEAELALQFPIREKAMGNNSLSKEIRNLQASICEQLWAIKGFAQRNAVWRRQKLGEI